MSGYVQRGHVLMDFVHEGFCPRGAMYIPHIK